MEWLLSNPPISPNMPSLTGLYRCLTQLKITVGIGQCWIEATVQKRTVFGSYNPKMLYVALVFCSLHCQGKGGILGDDMGLGKSMEGKEMKSTILSCYGRCCWFWLRLGNLGLLGLERYKLSGFFRFWIKVVKIFGVK